MRYKLIKHEGFEPAVLGMMLSYGKTSYDNFEATTDDINRVAAKLSPMDGGHNKFLEQIQYWILIQAPLFWWKQFDTYRVGVSKSSESTMHRSWKRGIFQDDFDGPVFLETIRKLNEIIEDYRKAASAGNPLASMLEQSIISNLPDGYLQTRLVNINAKSLRNMYFQRKDHKLSQWRKFCEWIRELPYGRLITGEKQDD